MWQIKTVTPYEMHVSSSAKFRAGVNKLIELWQQELADSREVVRENSGANNMVQDRMKELADGIYDEIEEIKRVRKRNKGEWRDDIVI